MMVSDEKIWLGVGDEFMKEGCWANEIDVREVDLLESLELGGRRESLTHVTYSVCSKVSKEMVRLSTLY